MHLFSELYYTSNERFRAESSATIPIIKTTGKVCYTKYMITLDRYDSKQTLLRILRLHEQAHSSKTIVWYRVRNEASELEFQ